MLQVLLERDFRFLWTLFGNGLSLFLTGRAGQIIGFCIVCGEGVYAHTRHLVRHLVRRLESVLKLKLELLWKILNE